MAGGYTVIIAPEAAAEVAAIATWWNEHRPAAPRLFQTEFDRALVRISERPDSAPRVRMCGRSDVHAVVLQRSGYLVFYCLDVRAREVIVVRVRRGIDGRFIGVERGGTKQAARLAPRNTQLSHAR